MEKEELKEVTQRVMKEVLSERPYGDFFWALLNLDMQSKGDFKKYDISAIIQGECSSEEIASLKKLIIESIEKELLKEYSLFITTKLMLALWALQGKVKPESLNNRQQFCFQYIIMWEPNLIEGHYDKALEIIKLLD